MAAAASDDLAMLTEFVESTSVDKLKTLTKEQLMVIMMSVKDPQVFQKFMFMKNKKIFGGMDGYVSDFLERTDTVGRILAMPAGPGRTSAIRGAISTLNEMKMDAEISAAKKALVEAALARLAGAQGGSRRKSRHQRRKAKLTRRRR
jgi:hypothetical protein